MLKKVVIGLFIIMTLLGGFNYAEAEKSCSGTGANKLTGKDAANCIGSTGFTISVSDFDVGGGKIGGEDVVSGTNSTEETMGLLLGVIIKNLIVIFGVLSLLTMTIGGGYMIFHSGDDSLLSRGKSIFMYGLVSLAVALSAGIMVQLISYILY